MKGEGGVWCPCLPCPGCGDCLCFKARAKEAATLEFSGGLDLSTINHSLILITHYNYSRKKDSMICV